LQLVRQVAIGSRRVAIGSAAKLQPQGPCICYTECTGYILVSLYIYIYRINSVARSVDEVSHLISESVRIVD
jgi:hypothetical protein